ncbi:toxin-antitoxin system YwqK family antitoxin [Tenacibaculum jejuense]|uniref:Probable lipoprotein n=1 Tax=Tenacibaculum jejuense TaxID=584609 RepID=A0A238UAV3_9FLAO|nr:hypothetical protein [Tenacibaculum jejuense]SNR16301.1 Probable lipoprotein precursor [Tenacibaculum jejuense]
MKRFFLVIFVVFLSCKKDEIKYQEEVFNTTDFKLVNGELFLKQNLYSGKLTKYDTLNRLKTISNYLRGKKEGQELKYLNDTLKIEERFYTKGKKSGIHNGWWPNGNKRFEYHFNTTGAYNGEVNEWYKNGQQMKAFHFVKGKEEGKQQLWRDDGRIRANFVTKNGDRFGLIGLKKCYTVNTVNESYK